MVSLAPTPTKVDSAVALSSLVYFIIVPNCNSCSLGLKHDLPGLLFVFIVNIPCISQ